MSIKRRKPSTSVEHRLTKVEMGLRAAWEDIREIKANVSNHIPTSIEAVKKDLETLLDRKKGSEAVRSFLNNFLKLSVSLASLVWVGLQIIKIIKAWN